MKELELQIDAVCENCSFKIKVNKSTVETTTFMTYDNEIVYVIWYKCPKCGRVHYIQIDNDNTKKILEYSKDILKKVMVYNSKYQTPPKKLKNKLDKVRKKLTNSRIELMKKYNKTVFKDLQTREEVVVSFSL